MFNESKELNCINDDNNVRSCPEERDYGQVFVVTMAYPICCTVSNVFLLITFCVYLYLPELRRPLFGKLIMAFIANLFCAYFCLSLVSFGHLNLILHTPQGEENNFACRLLGALVVFFFLNTFFWMNVLSYDIWRKFTRTRNAVGVSGGVAAQSDRRRLLRYTAYAMGTPLTVTLVTLIVEYLPEDVYVGLRPGFGIRNCFFNTPLASFVFFHVHIVAIQVSNVAFFALTMRTLFRTWRASRKMNLQRSVSTVSSSRGITAAAAGQEQSLVILTLFVVMGVTWLSEFIWFLSGWIFGQEKVWKYFVINDIINLSQGIFIFVLLICKKTVYRRLKDKLIYGKREPPQSNIAVVGRRNAVIPPSTLSNRRGGNSERDLATQMAVEQQQQASPVTNVSVMTVNGGFCTSIETP